LENIMQIAPIAAVAFVAVSVFTVAIAQAPDPQSHPPGYVADSQSTYPANEVAAARQTYRAACQRHQSAAFCECLAAAVAQAMPPRLVMQASNGIGDRIAALGTASSVPIYRADARAGADDPEGRIVEVEGHYANACQQHRG
jgi:hypothetical protein